MNATGETPGPLRSRPIRSPPERECLSSETHELAARHLGIEYHVLEVKAQNFAAAAQIHAFGIADS